MKNTLLDNFYTELSSSFSAGNKENFSCRIHLNAEHAIYKGHFAQVPVVPGVCLTQMIKEILMEKLQEELVMLSADNIKFLAMINPLETSELELNFSVKTNAKEYDVTASYASNGKTYTKFKGRFSSL